MVCPKCGDLMIVKDTWPFDEKIIYRKRLCRGCGFKFATKEVECPHEDWGKRRWRSERPKENIVREIEWDKEKGTQLFKEGLMLSEIARAVGQPYHIVYRYAVKHWY